MDDDFVAEPQKNLMKDQLYFIMSKLRHYAGQINISRLRLITKNEAPSFAYEKAFRSLCLTLKALGNLFECKKIVRHDEMFTKWNHIC